MKTSREKILEAASRLRDAWNQRIPCSPVRDLLVPGDIDGAYEVQRTNVDLRIDAGGRPVGRKIGLTAKSVQTQLGVDQPDYGIVFDDMLVREDEAILSADLMQARIETEIALILESDITVECPNIADIVRATAYALPALELLSSRIANWDINIQDTIADNASANRIVLGGTPRRLNELDLELCGMKMEKNGEIVSVGVGAACLGNPLNAAVWLARRMVEVGMPLRAGDIIMTGALGPMVPVGPHDRVESRIAGMGSVRAQFAE